MTHSTQVISPSPIIEVYLNDARRDFPESERKKLTQYAEEIGRTTSEGDPHRARMCLKWALHQVEDANRSHPRWEQLKERFRIWREDWSAFDFGIADAMPGSGTHHRVGKAEPIEDVRIQWAQAAVDVARRIGEEEGWENSPWQGLLSDLIAYGRD
jgi:hypothetical protein